MRQIIAIAVVGLALPFMGNILASMQMGKCLPSYFRIYPNIYDYLWFIFVLEFFNLIPVVLCTICYMCAVLKKYRYIPIGVVYLFIIYNHYEMAFSPDGLAGLVIIAAPLASVPLFFVSFMFSLIVFLLVQRITDNPIMEENVTKPEEK